MWRPTSSKAILPGLPCCLFGLWQSRATFTLSASLDLGGHDSTVGGPATFPPSPNPANGGVIHQGAPKHRIVLQRPECCCSGEALFPLEPPMSAAAPPAALPAVLPAEGPQEPEEPVLGHEAALAAEDVQSASTTSDRAAVLVLSPPSVSTPSWSHQRPRRRYSTASVVSVTLTACQIGF